MEKHTLPEMPDRVGVAAERLNNAVRAWKKGEVDTALNHLSGFFQIFEFAPRLTPGETERLLTATYFERAELAGLLTGALGVNVERQSTKGSPPSYYIP